MPFWLLKYLHVAAMFVATALAVGPAVTVYLVVRGGDVSAIRRVLASTALVFRAGGIFYGLGVLFGILSALAGSMDLIAPWLLVAYALVGALLAANLFFERWTRRVERSLTTTEPSSGDLARVAAERSGVFALAAMIAFTLAIVLVMVIKAELIG